MDKQGRAGDKALDSRAGDRSPQPGPPGAQTIVYLHGLLSSARSTKARFLRERLAARPGVSFHAVDFNPTLQDFQHMTTTGRIDRFRQFVLDHGLSDLALVGSSFGGLVALHYAHRFGSVTRMLLLAPALMWLRGALSDRELQQWQEAGAAPVYHPAFGEEVFVHYGLHVDGLRYNEPVPPAARTIIIHGRQDVTVPIAHSRAYATEYPDLVRLIEVDAGHDLNPHLDLIWDMVESFVLDGGPRER